MSAQPPRRTGGDADRPFGASLTRKRSGGGPGAQAERRAQRVALRTRQSARRPSMGAHSACRPANASSISDSTPAARTIRLPPRRPTGAEAGRSCRLPPQRRTSTRLWPARTPATSRSSTSRSRAQPSKPDREHAAGAPRHPAPRSQEAWQFGRHCVEQSRLRPRPSSRRRNLRRHTPSPRPALGGGRRRAANRHPPARQKPPERRSGGRRPGLRTVSRAHRRGTPGRRRRVTRWSAVPTFAPGSDVRAAAASVLPGP